MIGGLDASPAEICHTVGGDATSMSTVLGVGFNVTAAEVIAQVLDTDRWRFLYFEASLAVIYLNADDSHNKYI
jgi:hypothetical protein